ncbi:MAG: energy-coupling factor transporter transmembrane protein EcfT [Clostridia bacterium]|nr:energy-coupling factor transporter transmembrane protein EcfT [Clostridia bacterium]
MLKDITLGQYVPGESFIHKLDARVKIVLTFVYIIILFIIDQTINYALFTIFTAMLVFLSRVPIGFILKGLKPMLFILSFTAVINLFMTQGETIWSYHIVGSWSLEITKEGIVIAVLMLLRLLYLVIGTSLLTLTTSPLMLTDGIEKLLEPFKKIGVPSHEIAMMMTIAIRFIPTLAEETDKIMKAQMARGADFESGNIVRRAKAMIPLLVPLFVSAFRRADDLAVAMESRCYRGGDNRTRMKQMKATYRDAVAGAVVTLFCLVLIVNEIIL